MHCRADAAQKRNDKKNSFAELKTPAYRSLVEATSCRPGAKCTRIQLNAVDISRFMKGLHAVGVSSVPSLHLLMGTFRILGCSPCHSTLRPLRAWWLPRRCTHCGVPGLRKTDIFGESEAQGTADEYVLFLQPSTHNSHKRLHDLTLDCEDVLGSGWPGKGIV